MMIPIEILTPFLVEIRRIEKEYGLYDRPPHQYQCLMIEARDIIALLEYLKKC